MTDPIGLDEAYAVRTPDDSRRLYARWAETYDTDFVDATQYRYPELVADLFVAVAPGLTGPVLDVGCGTGLVGTAIAERHPDDPAIDGVDISPEMIDRAARRQRPDGRPVYHRLIEADLTQPVDVPDHAYAALVSAGTFTHGHLGPTDLTRLTRLVRPGGTFVVGVNAQHYAELGFGDALDAAVRAGEITDLQLDDLPIYGPDSPHAGDLATLAVFRCAG